jgi:hypothetical protein
MSQYTARIEPQRRSNRIQATVASSRIQATPLSTQNGRAPFRSRRPAYGDIIENSRLIANADASLR